MYVELKVLGMAHNVELSRSNSVHLSYVTLVFSIAVTTLLDSFGTWPIRSKNQLLNNVLKLNVSKP